MEAIRLAHRELATIVAALRIFSRRDAPCPEEEIATDGGSLELLSASEIEALFDASRLIFPPIAGNDHDEVGYRTQLT